MKKKPLLGAHVSVAGGLHHAPGRGLQSDCDLIQIFARYPTRWESPELEGETVEKFKREQEKTGIYAVATHASYLINLAANSPSLYERSISAMADEMRRAEQLGIANVVLHPGSAGGTDIDGAILRVARAVGDLAGDFDGTRICLETTAGQGTTLGYRLSHISEIIEKSGRAERIFVCLDSCHLFASGYDITSEGGFRNVTDELQSFGLAEKVRVIHLNDSKRERGSRVDRHEHIGEGMIGLRGFSRLLNHPPFRGVPFILETPKGDAPALFDAENLRKLRKLVKRKRI